MAVRGVEDSKMATSNSQYILDNTPLARALFTQLIQAYLDVIQLAKQNHHI